jgi:predicted transcriptional regulator
MEVSSSSKHTTMKTTIEVMVERKALIDAVIEQILKDVEDGDTTAVWELLSFIPYDNLLQFLPEEEWSKY